MNLWQKTKTSYLVRRKDSQIYYARVGSNWKSLDTKVETVAKTKLSQAVAELRAKVGTLAGSDLTLGECATLYLQTKRNQGLKPMAMRYREQTLDAIKKNWSGFDSQRAATVTKQDCEAWDRIARPSYSASRFNGQLQTLRGIFDEAIAAGCRTYNPAKPLTKTAPTLKQARVVNKERPALTPEQMEPLWNALKAHRGHAYIFCRFLYHFTLRLDTVNNLTPAMVDRKHARFNIPGQFVKGEREGTVIRPPIFPEMFKILDELDKQFGKRRTKLLPISGCLDLLRDISKKVFGIKEPPFINHHSFRHMFTTHAIMKGVPVPVLAKWLNHKDGGALLLKRYNHVLDDISREHAAKLVL